MQKPNLMDLERFAREKIGADNHSENTHVYVEAECDKCGLVPFKVTREHWNGDSPIDFYGIVWLQCSVCGQKKEYLSILEECGKPSYTDECKCKCNNPTFYVASCDRIEVWEDTNIFDEGVVVGKCNCCGSLQIIALT
nr:hypothetical protein [Candidatus Freyarchaeota archaeon]